MNAAVSSGSRVRSWCWVLVLTVIVFATTFEAGAGAPQARKSGGIAPFHVWLGIVGNQGSASFAHDAVLLCKDFADPGTLQVPNRMQLPIQPAKAQAKNSRIMPERMKMLGTAGCLMLPGWRLRLTTLSLLAR